MNNWCHYCSAIVPVIRSIGATIGAKFVFIGATIGAIGAIIGAIIGANIEFIGDIFYDTKRFTMTLCYYL